MLAICADTLLGVLRAIKFRQFNSSVGIDGAIRGGHGCQCRDFDAGSDFIDSCESSGFYYLRNMCMIWVFRNWGCANSSVCCLQPVNVYPY